MRYLALLSVLMVGGCGNETAVACFAPAGTERVYPFSGEWVEKGSSSSFCVDQLDAMTAMVWIAGDSMPGVITRDGSLVIADRTDEDPHLYVARLVDGALYVNQSLSATDVEGRLGTGKSYRRERNQEFRGRDLGVRALGSPDN
jgi:hypothetical protein